MRGSGKAGRESCRIQITGSVIVVEDWPRSTAGYAKTSSMFQQAPPDTAEVEAGLVHVGRGMPHAFVTAPDSPAQLGARQLCWE